MRASRSESVNVSDSEEGRGLVTSNNKGVIWVEDYPFLGTHSVMEGPWNVEPASPGIVAFARRLTIESPVAFQPAGGATLGSLLVLGSAF